MDRLERLINLVAALIDAPRPLTREAIRERVGGYAEGDETFRRNFERDKDLLRQMGFPLELEPLDPAHPEVVGYRIPRERYELPDPGLDADELAALHLAASSVAVEGGWGRDAATTALRKLVAASDLAVGVPPGRATGTEAVAAARLPTDERVAVVFAAVAERQAVRFRYRGVDRRLDPWHLAFRRGQWYLSGWDHARQSERMFRLDRVEGQIDVDGPPGAFSRPAGEWGAVPPPWRIGDEEAVVARLWVDADQADLAAAELGADATVERDADGAARFDVTVTNRAAFRSFVLGMLDHAEILGPPELRADMIAWLEGMALEERGR